MSEGRYGATVVWAKGGARQVAGVVTGGDLRRAMAQGGLDGKCAGDLASTSPKVLDASALAAHAAQWMQEHSISQVVVMNGDEYLGMVHIHDCLREGLV